MKAIAGSRMVFICTNLIVPSLEGKTVTADALHCQKTTARMILEKGRKYFLQIKANQKHLRQMPRQAKKTPPFYPNLHWSRSG
jgi:hypothetical protein